jgi:hypothetical protein
MLSPKPLSPFRLRERKHMTICIGILASDGIVIAADAQESDTYMTRSQQKILTWHSLQAGVHGPTARGAACVIAGAGDGGFVDAFSHEILKSVKTETTMFEFEQYLEDRVYTFYEKHVRPMLSINAGHDFQVLIGAYFGFQTSLFTTYKSTVRRVAPNAAIGIGSSFAMRIMDEYSGISNLRTTEVLAASVIATTKDCIEGCGKYTDIVSIHNANVVDGGTRIEHPSRIWHRTPQSKIVRWEQSFGTSWALRQRELMEKLIAEELKKDDELEG